MALGLDHRSPVLVAANPRHDNSNKQGGLNRGTRTLKHQLMLLVNTHKIHLPRIFHKASNDIFMFLVFSGAASLLGSTVRQTASGIGSLISGGSDFAGNLAGNLIPVFGSSLKDIIGGTGSRSTRSCEG